jgi:hypothetical protein
MGGLDNLRKAEAKAEAEEEKKDSEAIARGWPAFGRNYELRIEELREANAADYV